MIKLVASDLDGTLLQNGARTLSDRAVQLIRKAKGLGIQFVAASGRQYPNMKQLFREIWEDVIFVAENGALIVYRDEIWDKTVMDRALARELIRDLYRREECDVVVSAPYSMYMQPKPRSQPYIDYLLEISHTLAAVDDLAALEEEILKVSALVYDGRSIPMAEVLRPRWQDAFHVAVSGSEWVDFTLTTKGDAIEKLRRRLSLDRSELVAFGDNFNDESMFGAVGYSYAMAGAREEIHRMARHQCAMVEDVLDYLLQYIEATPD